MHDPYVYPNTYILKNRFAILDAERLNSLEMRIFLHKAALPLPKGRFNYTHLKAIHRHFFAELYPWAGEPRTIDMSKGNTLFGHCQYIGKALDKLFTKLAQHNYLQHLTPAHFIKQIAYYFNEIDAAHPFREGNGRTMRAFCDLLATQAGYAIDWTVLANREDYITASIGGIEGNDTLIENIFKQVYHPKK